MGVILQAAYRRQADPTISVPAPSDGDGDPWWYDHIASQCKAFAEAGFKTLQLPPVSMTIGGDSPSSDGYGVFNEYDLGSEDKPTRFGSAERLQRMCAIAKANGLELIADWVPHQRYGGDKGVYHYSAAGGSTAGRFPKDPQCFCSCTTPGGVPRDPIDGPVSDDFGFGDELCPINAIPKGYVMDGLIDAGDWLYSRLDLDGCRDDDTKGQALAAITKWANAKAMAGKPVIGECADGNRSMLQWWVGATGMRCYAYDFSVKYNLESMCNNGSKWDMTQLQSTGLASFGYPWGMYAVTFIENADSDTDGFGAVIYNKVLGYAFILTSEGWPSVYYRDYSTDKYCYGLKPWIDNLIWIHEHLANGFTAWRHAEYQFVVYERLSSPGLLVGLNNDVWGGWKTVTVQTAFGPNVHLHDYTGNTWDQWTDENGVVTIYIPPNDNGKGYCCFSRAGIDQPNEIRGGPTTQVFEGAEDLDIPPAGPSWSTVQRLWCTGNSLIQIGPQVGVPAVSWRILDPGGASIPLRSTGSGDEQGLEGSTTATGWHTLQVKALPSETAPVPFTVAVTYSAPQTL